MSDAAVVSAVTTGSPVAANGDLIEAQDLWRTYAMGAEEPPTGGFQARPHAASDFLRSFHRRFRWIVADVPRRLADRWLVPAPAKR